MISWEMLFFAIIYSVTVLLSLLGLWFSTVIPGIDRNTRRFFVCYFCILILCVLSGIFEVALTYYSFPKIVVYIDTMFECFFLSLLVPLLTVYLLQYCGEDLRDSKLFDATAVLAGLGFLLIFFSLPVGVFSYDASSDCYIRGPYYPLMLIPFILILLLTLAGTIRRRTKLSRRIFIGFFVAILPMTAALITLLFIDIYSIFGISVVLSALFIYGAILADQLEREKRNQQELLMAQQEIARERASVMVLRMRPHFIYNTLVSIYSLCNIDPQKARAVTLDFTNYLRKNFDAVSHEGTIPFSVELEHTKAYLSVEQTLYEDMLMVEYDTEFIHFQLPPLTLQPLVENAVKHGMDPYAGPLSICIRTRNTNEGIRIIVEDDGKGFEADGDSAGSNGTAGETPGDSTGHTTLENIRQRLQMYCDGSMTIRPRDGGGTVVEIALPTPPVFLETHKYIIHKTGGTWQ